MLRKHKDKLNNESYSIGIAKHVPSNGVNLAYISAPEITADNISIVNEVVGIDAKEEYNERDNLHYAKDDSSFITELSGQDILITDEFSLKKYSDEVPEPLFYKTTLKKTISGSNITNNNKYVPYQYGYTLKTEDMIKADNTSNNKDDVTPLIYKETYENGYNNIISITTSDGEKVLSGFKLRLVKQVDDTYSLEIYNNFDQDKIHRVSYIDSNGVQTTEVIESSYLFTGVNYDVFESKLGDPDYWMVKEYAIKQEGKQYQIFSPTQMTSITDENRKPFEFKYRVFANLDGNYSKSNPASIKIGMVFLDNNVSDDAHSALVAFKQSIGAMFPDYIGFMNPHPPLKYATQNEEYKDDQEYWDADLTAPQDYINDYDIIVITGYGTHDLSAFNNKLKTYLEAGGKVLIDNLSNQTLEILNIEFGAVDPIVSYVMDSPALTGNKEFGLLSNYKTRHYDLDNDMVAHIAYIYNDGEEVTIGPSITLIDENANEWEDIIKYSSGSRSIAVKTYSNKGKVMLSNCGIIKAFSHGDYDEAKKFVANSILILAEDIWEVTPWIYDRVYHKNQLYKNEYTLDKYVTDISPLGGNQIVAKKILSSNVNSLVSYYTGTYGLTGRYYVEAYERSNNKDFIPLTSVYLPTTIDSGRALYAFARSTNNTNFNITSVDGYEDSNIYPYSAPITFKVAITPFTFRWANIEGTVTQELIEASALNRVKVSYSISKDQGFVNLGLLSTLLPPLPSGPDWADKSKIFFRVDISGEEEIDGSFLNTNENRINLYIYDKFTGNYIYASDSSNIISYDDIHKWREIEKKESGGSIMAQSFNDIIVQASTNYYELVASKRIYAIVNNTTKSNIVKLPSGLNTNESWFPRIRYMRFAKSSFDKDDYDRISKTIGFRYDKQDLIDMAQSYFGEDPEDSNVADIIARLSGDETVDANDMSILAEAFSVINEEALYEYNMMEYFSQAWDEYPYKSIKNEYAQYVDSSTIRVQYTPMNISKGENDGEVLVQVTPKIYKSQNENWLPSMPIVIQMETEVPDVWESLADGFSIDYANGVIMFNTVPERSVRASYHYSNIKVIKKNYMNIIANMEELTQLQDRTYIIANATNRAILAYPNSQVTVKYTDGQTKILVPGSYTIDYNLGILSTKDIETGTVYMTYSYANIEYIEVKDYDTKHGIIELSRNVHFNDNIYVSYSYKEDYYEYKGYYDAQNDRFMYIDLNPTRGHECTYPTVVEDEVIYNEVPTYKLLGKTLYLYLLPSKVTKGNTIITQDITIRHTFNKNDLMLLQMAHPELIVIGSIKMINNYTPYDIITLDTRKRGGGLNESISREKIERTDELSLNLWDITAFDGRSFHPNGITIIKLPKGILIDNGGRFTNDDVKEIVEKHLALGVMPIIKYY